MISLATGYAQHFLVRAYRNPAAALRQQTATIDRNNSFTFACCMVLWGVKDVWFITLRHASLTVRLSHCQPALVQQ